MQAVREALDRFLRAHEPYPAVVLDRHYNIVGMNDATAILTAGVAEELLLPPANALRLTLHPQGMARRITNFDEWSSHLLHRLERQVANTGDAELRRLHHELSSYPGVRADHTPGDLGASEIVLPLRILDRESELTFFSTVSTFGTAFDLTLDELSIEAFYPADASTANKLLAALG
jgi:hypothetical protein